LYLAGIDEYDGFLPDLLRRRLSRQDGVYVWPQEICSALVYWESGQADTQIPIKPLI